MIKEEVLSCSFSLSQLTAKLLPEYWSTVLELYVNGSGFLSSFHWFSFNRVVCACVYVCVCVFQHTFVEPAQCQGQKKQIQIRNDLRLPWCFQSDNEEEVIK